MSDASIALNRFGLGALPDQTAPDAPRRWLLDQFGRFDPRPAPIAALPGSRTPRDYANMKGVSQQLEIEGRFDEGSVGLLPGMVGTAIFPNRPKR